MKRMVSKNQIKYFKSLENKKFRDQYGVFVAEGPKVVNDLKGHFELVELLEGEDADRVSFLDTPQHLFAVFKKATVTSIPSPHDELMLALDDIQNPGNLGTIIRLADWFGIEHIICSRGCADVYNPKVVQATMGALARVQIHEFDLPQAIADLQAVTNFPIYGTFLNGDNIYQTPLQPRPQAEDPAKEVLRCRDQPEHLLALLLIRQHRQNIRETYYRIQWRTNLMGHISNEDTLHTARVIGSLCLTFQQFLF